MFRRGIQDVLVHTLGWLPAHAGKSSAPGTGTMLICPLMKEHCRRWSWATTVGGTGKTPLTGRLVLDLENILGKESVGILSRGYGRDTPGFQWVTPQSTSAEAGDEPVMLARKLPHAAVAVCEDRLQGLERMRDERPELRWVVCDGAFQHRALTDPLHAPHR